MRESFCSCSPRESWLQNKALIRSSVPLWILLAAPAAQQPLWQRAGDAVSPMAYLSVGRFGDYNQDGNPDLFVVAIANPGANATSATRIVSGPTGSTLFQFGPSSRAALAVADFDQDGQRDYIATGPGILYYTHSLEVMSFATGQMLWAVEGPGEYNFGWENDDMSLTADLDLTGDGRPDLLAMTNHTAHSVVYAYDNSGAPLYQITINPYGWVGNNVTAMPDLDGDGAQDFLVGCIEPSGRGAVAVVSGRTGSLLRLSYGVSPGDYIGGTVCNAGDVDQDGMVDYAAASYWSAPQLSIVIFSGRTGAVLRNLVGFGTEHNGMTGNVDVDLDGIPDLIVGGFDRVRAFSGRDSSVLWDFLGAGRPYPVVSLGPDSTSPYPVIAFVDHNYYGPAFSFGRAVAFRANLLGTGPVSGTPCSSTPDSPLIGMRSVPGHVRITVSNGPPGAMAWLVGGPAGQTSFEGAPLPYALDGFGLFGCSAYVAPVVVVPATLGTAGVNRGYAAFDLPWPALSPSGHAFAAQWLLIDPATGNYALTARHEFRIP